jgi:UDP-3-O-[3-hydroxymyristoyl] glucosamine N-acyltransferase
MSEPFFFRQPAPTTLREIVEWTGASAPAGADLDRIVTGVETLDHARPGDLSFLDNPRYAEQFARTAATACLVAPRFASRTPAGVMPLVTREPYRALATVLGRLYPEALRPDVMFASRGVAPGAFIHPEARLETDVLVDPGVVVGARAEIGAGTRIAAHAVIGPNVRIGRDCSIGSHVSIQHALIGDRVVVDPGARIGQEGFAFVMGAGGHQKVPQVGRVIVQSDVRIGANTTVDRGAIRDTVIGEGTQIDNLVQIAHNVTIGRNCVIVAQVGISGSTELGDFVALGGQVGLIGHLKIGAGAQIAAQSGVMNNVPPGEKWGGAPAQPIKAAWRTYLTARRQADGRSSRTDDKDKENA